MCRRRHAVRRVASRSGECFRSKRLNVWVDGDSCPRAVRAILARASVRRAVPVTIVANRTLPVDGKEVLEVVEAGESSDDRILERAQPGDLVVTRDIPLAERVVHAGVFCMNDRGVLFDERSVAERRLERDRAEEIRAAAGLPMNPRSFGKAQTKAFADAFDRFLSKHLLSP